MVRSIDLHAWGWLMLASWYARLAVSSTPPQPRNATSNSGLQISFQNNIFDGQPCAYITGVDAANRLVVVDGDGHFYYPGDHWGSSDRERLDPTAAIALGSRGSTTNITMPGYLASARIWISESALAFFVVRSDSTGAVSLVEPSAVSVTDPNTHLNWGFVEFSHTASHGLFADVSYVDFVGLPLGMSLLADSSGWQTTGGVRRNAVQQICGDLRAQAAREGRPWDRLCQLDGQGRPLRVLAPQSLLASDFEGFEGYFGPYVDEVWRRYARQPLVIDTQSSAGHVQCRVQSDSLTCDGASRPFPKPACRDIFSCDSGPFRLRDDDTSIHRAIVPRLCAAFVRSTLCLDAGESQPGPASDYYRTTPTNWYSALVHQNEIDGRGYAFPYDDVAPNDGVDQSGTLSAMHPRLLAISIGGPSAVAC